MSPEFYDIMDTIVKIGLGALISGVSAYGLAKLNSNQKKEERRADRIAGMLETIANKMGLANSKLEEASHPMWSEYKPGETIELSDEAMKESLDLYLEVRMILFEIGSLSGLLGLDDLAALIRGMTGEVLAAYRIVATNNSLVELAKMNPHLATISEDFAKCYTLLSKFYDKA